MASTESKPLRSQAECLAHIEVLARELGSQIRRGLIVPMPGRRMDTRDLNSQWEAAVAMIYELQRMVEGLA